MRISNQKHTYANNFRVISMSYGLISCLIGVVLSTVEPFKNCIKCENHLLIALDLFFIYMNIVASFWMIAMFALIVRAKRQSKVSIKTSSGLLRRLSMWRRKSMARADNSVKRSNERVRMLLRKASNEAPNEKKNDFEPIDEIREASGGPLSEEDMATSTIMSSTRTSTATHLRCVSFPGDVDNVHFTYDYNNGTGELYMRIGIALFSVCCMIDRALGLVRRLEIYMDKQDSLHICPITFVLSVLVNITSLLFFFLQSFFIFKFANIVINYCQNFAVLGLMHIVCVNFCTFFRTVVLETLSEIRNHYAEHKIHDTVIHHLSPRSVAVAASPFNSSLHILQKLGCTNIIDTQRGHEVQEVQDKLREYLFPCIIEYSLMCMTVFFILWESTEESMEPELSITSSDGEIKPLMSSLRGENSHATSRRMTLTTGSRVITKPHHSSNLAIQSFTVDCGKSTSGLFLGMLCLLFTIVSLIFYFMYREYAPTLAVIVIEATELILVCFSLVIVIAIFLILRRYSFHREQSNSMSYNEILCLFGVAGIYIFAFYTMVAILNSDHFDRKTMLVTLVTQIVCVVESTLQSAFIIDSIKMHPQDKTIKQKKPARSLITLLIFVDVCLWLSETFSIKKYEMSTVQLKYYDIVFWSIVNSFASPLAIFFRFHASACLSDLWKDLYE